jgi:hypothetical protein
MYLAVGIVDQGDAVRFPRNAEKKCGAIFSFQRPEAWSQSCDFGIYNYNG